MKRLQAGIVCAVLLAQLTACASNGDHEAASEPPFEPAAAAETLLDSEAFTDELTEIDKTTACTLYGIDETSVTTCAVYASPAGAEELAVFAFADESAAETGTECLENRIADRTEELTDYMPDELPKLEKAQVKRRGKTALMVIANDYTPIQDYLGKAAEQ